MQVDFGEGAETEHNLHLTSTAAHYDHTGTGASPAYSPFRHPNGPVIDPGLEQSAASNRNGSVSMSSVPHHQHSPNHLLQPDNAAHLSHGFYGDMDRSSHTPPTPSNPSPRFSALSPSSHPKQVAASYAPDDRSPPPRNVSDETIDDAYAKFILYCNPSFAPETDTAELIKLFRIPPRSDGNAFSTWTLFGLIKKLNDKDIKTWVQLALELGVKPPNTDEGQSTQKVQQYSVRLKRWMRAMHVDAFFEYVLGNQHPYYLQIPPLHDPFPQDGRDGVPLEEDLAIRALDPKFKPKRGRRKADDGDEDLDMDETGTPARKRPQLDTSIPFGNALQPQSAYPSSAHPDHMGGFLTPQDPWTAASSITPSTAMTSASSPGRMSQKNLTPYSASPMSGQQLKWRLHDNSHNPHTPHPLSAVTPQSAYPFFDEPQSATTPSSAKPRSKKRHGPAVSSAWSAISGSSSGKLRGRPPSNRSIKDGPFVTFPANPKTREAPTIDRNPGNLTPIVERAHSDPPAPENVFRFPPTPASAISPSTVESSLPGGLQKQRLSLQVPNIVGNPVRLVTPTVLVNGEENQSPATASSSAIVAEPHQVQPGHAYNQHAMPSHQTFMGALTPSETPAQPQTPAAAAARPQAQASVTPATQPLVSLETLNRALAAELIRTPITGRRKRLRGAEAKTLATSILRPLYTNPAAFSGSPGKALGDQILGVVISSCLGLTGAVGLGAGGPVGGVKRIDCIRFRIGRDGYESPIDEDDEDADGMQDTGSIKETFDVFFNVSFGGLSGEWQVKGVSASTEADDEEEQTAQREKDQPPMDQNNPAAWKTKFLEAQRKLWESQEEVKSLKDKILEAVL